MGIQEDINWLKDDPDRIAAFKSIAKLGQATVRALKDDLRMDDWWPVKYHVNNLLGRGLVSDRGGAYALTETGKNVFESVKTMAAELGQV